jgi:ABC-type glutathione transport system ATPase component
MLIATHDLRLAAQIAQQVIFLEAGEVVEAGSARQMFTTPSAGIPSNTSPPSPNGCRRAGASSRFWRIESEIKNSPARAGLFA